MKTTLAVEGMTCSSCVRHVNQALAVRGVAAVDCQIPTSTVTVEHDASISRDRVVALLDQAGYPARVQSEG